MSELEDKLSAILGNPQLMQQIAAMAQSMGDHSPAAERVPEAPKRQEPPLPDPSLLQAIAGTLGQSGVDSDQAALLQALTPYVSTGRLNRLERAMRAAKLAGTASLFLNSGGLQLLTGR